MLVNCDVGSNMLYKQQYKETEVGGKLVDLRKEGYVLTSEFED